MRALVWTSLGAMALNAVMNATLMGPLGASGLALSTTTVTALFSLILGGLARRAGVRTFGPGDGVFAAKVLACATVTGGLVVAWSLAFERTFDVTMETARFLEVGGGLLLAAGSYAGLLRRAGVMLSPEAMERLRRLVKTWRRG